MTSNEGDVLMGFCPNCPEQLVSRPIPEPGKPEPSAVFCNTCKGPFPLKEMVDFIRYKTTTRVLAEKLGRVFDQLKGDCDIILKFHKADLRYDPRTEKDSDMRKRLTEARAGTYSPPFYPLHRILTDMKSGASAAALFENFLTA